MPAKPASKAPARLDARAARTMRFLSADKGYAIQKDDLNRIEICLDASCEMALVRVNEHCVMEGNDWDFHPGCHGFDLPDFKGPFALADLLANGLRAAGYTVEVEENRDWRYGEEEAAPPAKPRRASRKA